MYTIAASDLEKFSHHTLETFSAVKSVAARISNKARRAGSDGSVSASGSAGPGFDPRRGSKFSFENFQPRG